MGGFGRLGIFSALSGVADKQSRRQQDAQKQKSEALQTEAAMRKAGYVPDAEAGPDPSVTISGKTLDAAIGGLTGGLPMGMPDVQTPKRYGSRVGGYTYDKMNPEVTSRRLEDKLKESETAKNAAQAAKDARPPETHIDPLSPSGIVASGTRAGVVAKAEAPFKKDPNAQLDHYVFPTGTGPDGKPIVLRGNTRTGEVGSTGVAARQDASQGGSGGPRFVQQKRFVDLMTNALPTITALASKVRPQIIDAASRSPSLTNLTMNQDEQTYMRAMRDFVAGVNHQEGGARLNPETWKIGLQRYAPMMGDTPQSVMDKVNAASQSVEDENAALRALAPQLTGATGAAAPKTGKNQSGGYGMFSAHVPNARKKP